MSGAGDLRDRVTFDVPVVTPDGFGGEARSWSAVGAFWAEFRYQHGKEGAAPGGTTNAASFKVRIRSGPVTRGLTTDARMRDVARGVTYNIREVDAVSDRAHVWIVVESGVAV